MKKNKPLGSTVTCSLCKEKYHTTVSHSCNGPKKIHKYGSPHSNIKTFNEGTEYIPAFSFAHGIGKTHIVNSPPSYEDLVRYIDKEFSDASMDSIKLFDTPTFKLMANTFIKLISPIDPKVQEYIDLTKEEIAKSAGICPDKVLNKFSDNKS